MTPVEADGAMGTLGARADTVIRRDLDYSDRFEIVAVPEELKETGSANYGLWNQLGAVWLVSSQLTGTAAAPVLRMSLHDVVFGELKEVRAFSLPSASSSDMRMALHRIADEIVRWATGEPGIAASRIVFRRKLSDGTSDIWIIDSDGENLRRLTRDNSIVYSPDLSPDGQSLLYVSYVAGTPAVYERNLRTGAVRTISDQPGLNVTPVYSPDGAKIMLARSTGDHTELFELQRTPLCCARQITRTSAGETLNASFAPDGRRIAMTSSPLGLPQIYVKDLAGGEPRLISRYVYGERGYATSPDWSPRGDRIAYQAWVDNSFQVVAVSPDGGDRRILTSRGSNEDPSWAPDGRHLVFASADGARRALWVLDTVSGRIRSLTTGAVDQLPSWSDPIPSGF
jgi:TolB protein